MSLLLRSQLRFLGRSPWSAVSALAGVALGVASVVAVHLISAEVQRSLDAARPPHLTGLSHLLERPGLDADAYFDLRDWWRAHPGVAVRGLVPMVEGHVSLDGERVLVLGADWLAMPPGAAAGGEPMAVSAEVLVGTALLADTALGFRAGDTVTVAGRELIVAGVRDSGLGPALVADIALAHALLGSGPARVNRVGLALADPWQRWRRWLNRLMPGFGAGLPEAGPQPLARLLGLSGAPAEPLSGWRAVPVAAERPSAAFARAVLFNLGALGTLALLVAWFLVYQVGVIWLRRQRLVLERLYVVGVAPAVLRRGFLALFALLGSAATVIGAVLGVVLASALVGLSSQAIDVPVSAGAAAVIDPWLAVKALASGLGVCLVGGYIAFAREWRGAALAQRWLPWLLPALLGAVTAGIVLERTGVLGGFVAILAMSLVGVALVAPALGLLRRASTRLRGRLLIRLALREVAWYPHVLNVALAALTLAVATGIGVGLMVQSFRADFERMLDVRLAGDLYLYDVGGRAGALAEWLGAQPDVAAVSRFAETTTRVQGVPAELGYARFDAAESARYGFPRALRPGEALVNERLARDLSLAVGEAIAVDGGTLAVAGTFPGFGDPRGRLLVDVASLDRFGIEPRFDRLTVTLAERPRGTTQRSLAARLAERFPALRMEARGDIRALALRIFDRTFAITQALTLLALLVAVVGTYNALTALRLNQAATVTLLRAQGVSRAETRRIALIRAATVGGTAAVLALPLGVAMAWTLCNVINPRSFGWSVNLQLPVAGWLLPVLLGLAAALLAGMLPAPRERGALHEGV